MEFVIGLVSLLVVLFVALGAFLTVKAVRTVKRGVERTGRQVRRTVEETTLRARSAQPGPVGELARVRLELRASLDSTRRALEAGAARDTSLAEAVGLLDRLDEHARQLDCELRLLMEREPDRSRIAARLPEARERADRIRASADSLRFAAQDRAQRYGEEELTALGEQIEIEAGALRHWASAHGPDAAPGTGGGADGVPGASGAPRAAEAPGPSGTSSGTSGTSGGRAPEIEGGRDLRQGWPQGRGTGLGTGPGPEFDKGRPQGAS
ncbi:hypothetical protein ACFSJS_00460 [Streptomyces desertarenae]|uniref:Secreted protein n=1 Tax=Streptomyces desertarenae TaxID=2666184 RepID=A0ABW4PBU3_9ACTN